MSTLPAGTNADSAMFQYDPVTGKTYKWNSTTKEYVEFSKSDDVVHKTGDETILGSKTFINQQIIGGVYSNNIIGGYAKFRSDAQLEISNDKGTGHALISIYNHNGGSSAGGKEGGVTFGGRLSDGSVRQTGSFYNFYVNYDNNVTTHRNVLGFHLPDAFGDKEPLNIFSNNSVQMLGGDTINLPFNNLPPANTVQVLGKMEVSDVLSINSDLLYTNDAFIYSNKGGSGVRAGILIDGTNQTLNFYNAGSNVGNIKSGRLTINSITVSNLATNPTDVPQFQQILTPIQDTSLTTNQTSATLNAAYPSALVGQTVTARNVGTGMKYEKINTSGGGTWAAWPISII